MFSCASEIASTGTSAMRESVSALGTFTGTAFPYPSARVRK